MDVQIILADIGLDMSRFPAAGAPRQDQGAVVVARSILVII